MEENIQTIDVAKIGIDTTTDIQETPQFDSLSIKFSDKTSAEAFCDDMIRFGVPSDVITLKENESLWQIIIGDAPKWMNNIITMLNTDYELSIDDISKLLNIDITIV